MPEQKISDILSTIHERREYEKAFGPIEPEPEPEPLAIMDRVTPLQPEDPILDEFTESVIEELSSSEKKKKRTQKKKRIKQ